MHDPQTQAFVIPFPWYSTHKLGKGNWRYWHPFITIWHIDPERGGSDDSCGWFHPPFNQQQKEIVKSLASDEARDPWFMSLSAKVNTNPVECEAYVRGAFLLVARCMENRRCLRRKVTLEQATLWASLMVHNSIDNFRSSLAWLSGWHGNTYHDDRPNTTEEDVFFRERSAESFFGAIMRCILRAQRHWWEHPKYHIIHWKKFRDYTRDNPGWTAEQDWHEKHPYKYWGLPVPVAGWKLQIHPLQSFKRWAFSRCCKCGKGFGWGYAPVSGSWSCAGPRWFRSEEGVYHFDCERPTFDCATSSKAVVCKD
jgi:hypothetical protein